MKKDFSEPILKQMSEEKKHKVLYDLASFIEANNKDVDSRDFEKLSRYHSFLAQDELPRIQKINKEFAKIKAIDYQFQVYLMNLERFLGQSKKEYDFLVKTNDLEKPIQKFPFICLLDSIRSAHNIGAFFRNAECFGVSELILTGLSPTPELDQVRKTAMGCDQTLEWSYKKNAVETIIALKERGYKIWSIETARSAENLNTIKNIPKNIVLVFGHEQHGISHEILQLSDKIISIELFGQKNSLNVSVSQAIVLNYLTSQVSPE